MKAYTDIEQQKRLAEILPIESSDMEYLLEQWFDEKTHRYEEGFCEIPVVKVEGDCPLQPITLPCWSLVAFLDGLNSGICFEEVDEVYRLRVEKDGTWWNVIYVNPYDRACTLEEAFSEDIVNSCFDNQTNTYGNEVLCGRIVRKLQGLVRSKRHARNIDRKR